MNFFQRYEQLRGLTMADLYIKDPNTITKALKEVNNNKAETRIDTLVKNHEPDVVARLKEIEFYDDSVRIIGPDYNYFN